MMKGISLQGQLFVLNRYNCAKKGEFTVFYPDLACMLKVQ